MNGDVWGLPGPQKFIAEIAHRADGGQHVAAVVPSRLLQNEAFSDGLTIAVMERLHLLGREPRRVQNSFSNSSLVEEIGQAFTFDDPPVTVPDLLDHPATASGVAVINDRDTSTAQRASMSDLLRRVDIDSRSRPPAERLTLIAIVSMDNLPHFQGGATTDVTLSNVWWWNRLSRWDIGAYLSGLDARNGSFASAGVLADVRTETIIELARWEFDLVDRLATEWSGGYEDLAAWVTASGTDMSAVLDVRHDCGVAPDADVMPGWDRCAIDGWHGSWSPAADVVVREPSGLKRRVWAAQARVLLPWIEEQRNHLQQLAIAAMGLESLCNALNMRAGAASTELFEIGPLHSAINARLGSTQPVLRDAARRLKEARNLLAHLTPLHQAQLEGLVRSCGLLRP